MSAARSGPATPSRSARGAERGLLHSGDGCQWRALPRDLPPRSTVHGYFIRWQCDRTLTRLHHALYVQVREQAGKQASPTTAIVDSQSVKSAERGAKHPLLRPALQLIEMCRPPVSASIGAGAPELGSASRPAAALQSPTQRHRPPMHHSALLRLDEMRPSSGGRSSVKVPASVAASSARVSRKVTTAETRTWPGIVAPDLRACAISARPRKALQAAQTFLIGTPAL